jgi:hypothetical protein
VPQRVNSALRLLLVSDILSAKIAILFDKDLCGMLKCLNSDKNKIEIAYLSCFSNERLEYASPDNVRNGKKYLK